MWHYCTRGVVDVYCVKDKAREGVRTGAILSLTPSLSPFFLPSFLIQSPPSLAPLPLSLPPSSLSAVSTYLNQDLCNEHLSQAGHLQRQKHAQMLDAIIKRINSTHPTIRPRVNTPGKMPPHLPPIAPKQPAPPPMHKTPPPLVDEQQDVYEEPVMSPSSANPHDYLDFEPGSSNKGEEEGPQVCP